MEKVYIGLHPKHHLAQMLFIEVANQSQNRYQFEPIQITYLDRLKYCNPNRRLSADQMCQIAYEIKRKHRISSKALFILLFDALIYDAEDDDLFFVTINEDEGQTPGVAVISSRVNTLQVLSKNPPKKAVANVILMNILSAVTAYFTAADLHIETTGCVLDYCEDMADIKYSLANGFMFCRSKGCHQLLEKSASGKAMIQIAENLTKNRIETIQELNDLIKVERPHMMLIANPVWGPCNVRTDPKSCFVLMPFREEFSDRIWSRYLRPIIKKCGLVPRRADDLAGRKIMEDIWKNILKSQIVIADMTSRNPNVFYELGMAHAIGKECILLAQSEKDVPFDLRQFRIIFYKDNADGYERLTKDIPFHIEGILNQQA